VSNKVQFSVCLIEHHDMKAYGGVLALGQYHDTSVFATVENVANATS
jgi:hypothetical protein